MNIQMILSALPTSLSGKPESGAGQGQFALALGQAAQSAPGQAGGATFSAPLSAAQIESLPPPTMAARQALLQALNTHTAQPLDGEAELALPDAQLNEIMARLALIEGTHAPQPEQALTDLPLLPDQVPTPSTDEMGAELAEQPQAAALVAAIAAEAQRADIAAPGISAKGESVARPELSAVSAAPAAPASGSPLTAQLAASAAAATQNAGNDTGDTARPVDFTSAFAKVTAHQATTNQAGGTELRAMTSEAARGGFVPDAATMTQAQPNGSVAGQANTAPQAAPLSHASLAAPLQSPAWPGQLGQQLVQFARQGGEQQVEMRLNPAELGPLSVTLKVTEQGAQAQFLSAHAQVRQVLEQAIPQLREALAEQGISLGETSVGEQRNRDAQAFAGRDGRGQGGAAQAEGDTGLTAAGEATPGTAATLALDGRVNLYA